jgi:hypothetical protein
VHTWNDVLITGGYHRCAEAGLDGIAVSLKHWLTKEECAALDQTTRDHYIAHGDEFTLKPHPGENRQKIAMLVLATLALTFTVIGIYGTTNHKTELQILGFCGAMPMVFGLRQPAMYLGWS